MHVKQIVPLQPGAYRQLFHNDDHTVIYDWPVVALAVLDSIDGPRFGAVVADWDGGFTLAEDMGNALGICESHEVAETIRRARD